MTIAPSRTPTDAIAPVREALLARAREDAAATLRAAEAAAEDLLANARAEADRIGAQARATGEADAAAARAAGLARAHRAARALMLGEQRAAYAALRERSRAALAERADAALRAALTARVARVLGEDAVVADAPGGGVLATAGERRADGSFDALVDHALAVLGPRLAGLWSP
jgi:cell division septum initiation protein DivIVA